MSNNLKHNRGGVVKNFDKFYNFLKKIGLHELFIKWLKSTSKCFFFDE